MSKNAFLTLAFLLLFSQCFSQVEAKLRIYHMYGNTTMAMDNTVQNNLGHSFQMTRLQYYVTRVSVIYDGGQVHAVNDTVVALIDVNDGSFSEISLGELTVNNVEGVRFHIGVFAPLNNGDPTLFDDGHPLALQNPSMHWGWADGYNFIAMEGLAGFSLTDVITLHGNGNSNYHETEVMAPGQTVDGTLIIPVNGDYTRIVENIDISSGVISQGDVQEAQLAIENCRDYVFSARLEAVGINEQANKVSWQVYPNPIGPDGIASISLSKGEGNIEFVISNALGQVVFIDQLGQRRNYEVHLNQSGFHTVTLYKDGQMVGSKKIIRP